MSKKLIQDRGKRKRAIARATLSPGKGKVMVNGQSLSNYSNEMSRLRISEPLTLAGAIAKKINIKININGGGVSGQADAIRLAIARALVQHDSKLKKTFDDYDRLLLVADVRRSKKDTFVFISRQKFGCSSCQ